MQGLDTAKALVAALSQEKWMSVRDVSAASGVSFFTAGKRLRDMYYAQQIDRKRIVPEHGGKQHVYRLLPEGVAQALYERELEYEPGALAKALGGFTFKPPRFAKTKTRVRHHLR